ncbi:hypothetical protein ABT255_02890 [Streptomyces mirabilis]|jgi:hypothetical protein
MSHRRHKASHCRLCAPLRRPGQVKVRRALVAGLARQTRANGENGGDA